MIQERLNQGLSVFGYLLRSTPAFSAKEEKNREQKQIERELKEIETEQKAEALKEEALGVPRVGDPERKMYTEDPNNIRDERTYKEHLTQAERARDLAERKLKLSPTHENAGELVKRDSELSSLERAREAALRTDEKKREAAERADKEAREAAEREFQKEYGKKARTDLILSVLNKQ